MTPDTALAISLLGAPLGRMVTSITRSTPNEGCPLTIGGQSLKVGDAITFHFGEPETTPNQYVVTEVGDQSDPFVLSIEAEK